MRASPATWEMADRLTRLQSDVLRRTCALRLPIWDDVLWRGGLLSPSSLHTVLAVKVCAHVVRLRPGGRR